MDGLKDPTSVMLAEVQREANNHLDVPLPYTRRPERLTQRFYQDRFLQLLASSSIHGLPHTVRASTRYYKMVWIVLLLGGTAGFVINLVALCHRYMSGPSLVIYMPDYEDFEWPDITFCRPSNPIPFWKYKGLGEKWRKLIHKSHNLTYLKYKNRPMSEFMFAMSTINPAEFHLDDVNHVVYRVLLTISTTSVSWFTKDDPMILREFDEAVYTRLDSTLLPLPCYTFNPTNLKSLGKRANLSLVSGIRFIVLMNHESYNIFNSSTEDRKLYTYLSYRNSSTWVSQPSIVLPGTENQFTTTMRREQRLPAKTNCIHEAFKMEMYDALLSSYREYKGSFQDCKFFVSQRHFYHACNCFNPLLPIYRLSNERPRLCLNFSEFSPEQVTRNVECLNRAGAAAEGTEEVEKECAYYRRRLCDEVVYSTTFDSLPITTDNLNRNRMNYVSQVAKRLPSASSNADEKFFSQNLALIYIHRASHTSDLAYEEFQYPLSQFVSDIGGIMGLWLGLSVVGLFELVEMASALLEVLASYCPIKRSSKPYLRP